MTAEEIFKGIMIAVDGNVGDVSEHLGYIRYWLAKTILAGKLKADAFIAAIAYYNCEMILLDKAGNVVPHRALTDSEALIADLAAWREKPVEELYQDVGWVNSNGKLNVRIKELRANDLLAAIGKLGLRVEYKDNNGDVIRFITPGHGRRLKGYSDEMTFDTSKSVAVCNSFYADGVNEYDENGEAVELYMDLQGRYFIAEYHRDAPEKDRVRAVQMGIVRALVNEYGTNKVKKKSEKSPSK